MDRLDEKELHSKYAKLGSGLKNLQDRQKLQKDKEKRLQPLRDMVADIARLRQLPPDNTDLDSWFDDLTHLIKQLCGPDSQEYQAMMKAPFAEGTTIGYPGEQPQDLVYRTRLNRIETVAKTILNRLEKGRAPTPASNQPVSAGSARPKIFISHGPPGAFLEALSQFLQALNIEPIIVEEQASEGRSVVRNVDRYAGDCSTAIVLATRDRDVNGEAEPNPGVLIEIGDLRQRFEEKIIYMVQAGVHRSSMWSEYVYIEFDDESLAHAFIRLARELTAAGLIRSCV